MPPVTYGHGPIRIDLNGPHGTAVSLARIGDSWATLCRKDRIHIAMFLTDPTDTPEQRYTHFASFFGDYATLYYGQGDQGTRGAEDPFVARPCALSPSHTKSKQETDYEDATVKFLIERYVASM
jgi:hypothetical protein